jgi:hypothetical protein
MLVQRLHAHDRLWRLMAIPVYPLLLVLILEPFLNPARLDIMLATHASVYAFLLVLCNL